MEGLLKTHKNIGAVSILFHVGHKFVCARHDIPILARFAYFLVIVVNTVEIAVSCVSVAFELMNETVTFLNKYFHIVFHDFSTCVGQIHWQLVTKQTVLSLFFPKEDYSDQTQVLGI